MTIHCRVTTFLSADTSRDVVTSTFDLLTYNSCRAWRVTWPTLPPSLKTLRLFAHELRVVTVPVDYHWKCVRGHCACTESRNPWVKNNYIFGIPDPNLLIHYTTFIGLRRRYLLYKQSYSKFSVKIRKIFVTMATGVVWAKFDWHHLIGRSWKPPTACKHLGRTSCTR